MEKFENGCDITDYDHIGHLLTNHNLDWLKLDSWDEDMICPQVGDLVYFVLPCYELFIKKYFGMFNFDREESIWPSDVDPEINGHLDGYLCRIVDIDCVWPVFRTKTQLKQAIKDLTATMILTLESA